MAVAPPSAHPGREPHRSKWLPVAILAVLLGALTLTLLGRYDVLWSSSSSSPTTEGSGVPARELRHVAAFDRVELAGVNNVVIRVGEQQSLVVRADDNLLDRVTTEVRSGNLVIANTSGNFRTKSPMGVEVGVPTINALTLTGSGNIAVSGIKSEKLKATLLGSGTLTGSGTAARLEVIVGGVGTAQFSRLVAKDVRAEVSGSGSIFATATKRLDASVSGSGAILYGGNPDDVTRSVTGTGAITGR